MLIRHELTVIVGQLIDVCIVMALAMLSWHIPRWFGVLGLFGAHFLVLLGFCAMVPVAMGGCFIRAFLFNCLFLPVTVAAVVRRRQITLCCNGPAPASTSPKPEALPTGPGD